ncbi:unnamed protein product [Enterobius vermicularis]|uniref:Uncharacterized protein n=1 Tax=Enterobius vermicularis TaxID=51028 RepID=A0A0N4V6K9_ENTVE|nr:unnamed protein product [Enterobius vermicularis]
MSCRTQLSKSGDCSGGTKRVQATRVDPKDVIDSMLESAVHEIELGFNVMRFLLFGFW